MRDAESPDFFRLDNRQGNQDDSSHSLTLLPIEVPTPKQPQNQPDKTAQPQDEPLISPIGVEALGHVDDSTILRVGFIRHTFGGKESTKTKTENLKQAPETKDDDGIQIVNIDLAPGTTESCELEFPKMNFSDIEDLPTAGVAKNAGHAGPILIDQ